MSLPDQAPALTDAIRGERAGAFVHDHYATMAVWAGKLLTGQEVANVQPVGVGFVEYPHIPVEGLDAPTWGVHAVSPASASASQIEEYRAMGFTQEQTRRGLWRVWRRELVNGPAQGSRDSVTACWDDKTQAWIVQRGRRHAGGWQTRPDQLTPDEENALKRVFQEGQVIIDAARRFDCDPRTYSLMGELALQRATKEGVQPALNAFFWPQALGKPSLGSHLKVTAPGLYGRLTPEQKTATTTQLTEQLLPSVPDAWRIVPRDK